MSIKRSVHFVISTHWDREWHQTFQDFRYRLVRLIDHLLAGWESGQLQGPFQTDGQTIVLDDYLEIRPERRAQITQLLLDGRLVAGPWYVMPDEFNVSGEALIRNLHLGRESVRALGAQPSAVGYVCDTFGHISQLPQILAGFSIPTTILWRGVNLTDRRNFIWQGADGTRIFAHRFGPNAYGDYVFRVRDGFDYSGQPYDGQKFRQKFAAFLDMEAETTEVAPILVHDGVDHNGWDAEAYEIVKAIMAEDNPRFTIRHTSLDAYAAEALPTLEQVSTVLTGELRDPGRGVVQAGQDPLLKDDQWLIPGVLSSRAPLKQANAACQALLCQWAEPFSALAQAALGFETPPVYLGLAWRWLLQNHPHDSIDACSIDQVHRDMVYRFDQCRQIANRVTQEALQALAAAVEGDIEEKELRVVVYNPLPRLYAGVLEVDLQIPTSWPSFQEFFFFEPKPAFRLFGPDGDEIPYERLAQTMGQPRLRARPARILEGLASNHVRVAFQAAIPALGYAAYTVRAGSQNVPTRAPITPGLAVSPRALQNEYLRLEVNPEGSLTLTDLRSGMVYPHQLTFEDRADIGDGWYHGAAVNDETCSSAAGKAEVSVVHNTPLTAQLRIRVRMNVPKAFDFGAMRRSEQLTELVIDNLVTLRQGQDWFEVHTRVENTAGDHRLRVLFPSLAETEQALFDSAFDVVERPIALRGDNHLYRELEVETRPQQAWTAVHDDRRGLAVISSGQNESAVCDQPDRPIALTLFRGTRRTIGTAGEPGGQLYGPLAFTYWVTPLSGAPDRVRLGELGLRVSGGLQFAQQLRADQQIARTEKRLPAQHSFCAVEGAVLLSSLRQEGPALEARLWNPGDRPAAYRLNLNLPIPGAPLTCQAVDLESNPLEEPQAYDPRAERTLAPKQIVTLRLAA